MDGSQVALLSSDRRGDLSSWMRSHALLLVSLLLGAVALLLAFVALCLPHSGGTPGSLRPETLPWDFVHRRAVLLPITSGGVLHPTVLVGRDGRPLVVVPWELPDSSTYVVDVLVCADAGCSSVSSNNRVYSGLNQYVGSTAVVGSDGLPLLFLTTSNQADGARVVHCSNATCSAFTSAHMDIHPDPAAALVVGVDGLPLLFALDWMSGYVFAYHCREVTCTSGGMDISDPGIMTLHGAFAATMLPTLGLAAVAWYRQMPSTGAGDVSYGICGDVKCTFVANLTTTPLLSGVEGSLGVLAEHDGAVVIAGVARNGTLAHVRCRDPTCGTANATQAQIIDNNTDTLGGPVGPSFAMTLMPGATGLPWFVYAVGGRYRTGVHGWGVSVVHGVPFSASRLAVVSAVFGADGWPLVVACAPDGLVAVHCSSPLCTPYAPRV